MKPPDNPAIQVTISIPSDHFAMNKIWFLTNPVLQQHSTHLKQAYTHKHDQEKPMTDIGL